MKIFLKMNFLGKTMNFLGKTKHFASPSLKLINTIYFHNQSVTNLTITLRLGSPGRPMLKAHTEIYKMWKFLKVWHYQYITCINIQTYFNPSRKSMCISIWIRIYQSASKRNNVVILIVWCIIRHNKLI